jgi:hypothetical protein
MRVFLNGLANVSAYVVFSVTCEDHDIRLIALRKERVEHNKGEVDYYSA